MILLLAKNTEETTDGPLSQTVRQPARFCIPLLRPRRHQRLSVRPLVRRQVPHPQSRPPHSPQATVPLHPLLLLPSRRSARTDGDPSRLLPALPGHLLPTGSPRRSSVNGSSTGRSCLDRSSPPTSGSR